MSTRPTYAWAELESWELGVGIPFPSSSATALRNNAQHLREWMGHSYTAARDHDHDGVNSAHPDPPLVDNLLLDPMPAGFTVVLGTGLIDLRFWERSHDSITARTSGGGVLFPGAEGHALSQRFAFGADDDRNQNMLGRRSGLELTCSLFARSGAAQEEGLLQFGFTEGDSAELLPGCEVQLDWTDLVTNWVRFYATVTLGSIGTIAPESAPLRFIVRAARTLTREVYMSGFMVSIGRRLHPFRIGNIGASYVDNYAGLSYAVPVWDRAIADTNAVRLVAV